MEEKDLMNVLAGGNPLKTVMAMNRNTAQFGLTLTEADAKLLLQKRSEELRKQQRVEFGEGILPKLLFAFCDSAYIDQDNYVETMIRLQEIFYLYKNETMDKVSDDELLSFMREQFEEVCCGDLEYLEGTCLYRFAEKIRASV